MEDINFKLPPLPTLKPNTDGSYTFCPKCAMLWLSLIFAAVVAVYLYKKRNS